MSATNGSRWAVICTAALVQLLWAAAWAPGVWADEKDKTNDEADEGAGIQKARGEVGELRYDVALATLSSTLKSGTSGPAATAQIYLLIGEVRASLGQRQAAEDAFQVALAIDSKVDLRKGVSPKIKQPFLTARRIQRETKPLEIATRVVRSEPPAVVVQVRSDPLGIVAGARAEYWTEGGGARSVAGLGTGEISLELPAGVSRFAVAAVDEHGNRLVELGSQDRPLSLETTRSASRPAPPPRVDDAGESSSVPAPPPAAERGEPAAAEPGLPEATVTARSERPGPPLYANWVVWGGVALGLGAVGTWAGLSAQSSVDDLEKLKATQFEVEFSDAKVIADRAEQRALMANIAFATAGASAILSGILYIRARQNGTEESAALVPVLSHDQVGLAAWLRF